MGIESLPISFQAVIPLEYMDQMGHMNVMWYTHLFNSATWKFFATFGMDQDYFTSHQTGAFALAAHVRYLAEVCEGNQVTIRSRAIGRSTRRFHFVHFLTIDGRDALAATGEFLGAHVNMKNRKTTDMPEFVCSRFDRLLQQHSALDWEPPLCHCLKP